MTTHKITVSSPSWESILKWLDDGTLDKSTMKEILAPAIQIADIVKNAQEDGKESVEFVFGITGSGSVEVNYT